MTKKLLLSALGLTLSAGLSAQSLNGISPSVGNSGQTLPIIISGQNTSFTQQASMTLFLSQGSFTIGQGSSTGFSNISILNNTTISATLSVPGSSPIGYYDLYVLGTGSSTLNKPMAFEVMVPGPPSVSVSPAGGKPGNTVNGTFTVSGGNFKSAAVQIIDKVWLSLGNEVITDVSNIQVVNSTTFTADVNLSGNVTQGKWDVNVYTDDNVMFTNPASFDVSETFSRKEFNQAHFEIYPNPVNDVLTATFEGHYSDLDARLIDLSGKPVSAYSYQVKVLENGLEVNMGTLPKGSYMIQFISNGETIATKKLVRQ